VPIFVPATAAPPVTVNPVWVRGYLTDMSGWSFDISSFIASVQTSFGRSSAAEAAVSASTCSLTLNDSKGTFDPDNTSSACFGKLTVGPQSKTTLRLGSGDPTGVWYPMFTGPFESLERSFTGGDYSETAATFVDQTPELVRHILPQGTVLPAEMAGARINRLLNMTSRSGFKWATRSLIAPLRLDTGQKILGVYTCDGNTTSWDIANAAAQAEGGLLFFSPDGVLNFHGQARRLTNTVAWTFADDGSGTPYETDLTLRVSMDDVIVDAAVTSADQVTSVYGPGGLTRTTNPSTHSDLTETSQIAGNITGAGRAQYLYDSRHEARRNAPVVTMNAAPPAAKGQLTVGGHPSPYAVAVQGTIADLASMVRTPATGSVISAYHWIEGWKHSLTLTGTPNWTATFNVSRADPLPSGGYWELGVSELGVNNELTW
jgi:hypothetical protein